jgi:hypothetical protein
MTTRIAVPGDRRDADGAPDASQLAPRLHELFAASYRTTCSLEHVDAEAVEMIRLRNAFIQRCHL